MGLMTISKEDIQKYKPLAAGWHIIDITSYNEKADKDGASLHQYGGVVVEGPNGDKSVAGRPIPMEPPGNIQFSEKAPSMATNFIDACAGKATVGDEGGTFDMKDPVGKRIKANNQPKLYNGRTQNNWVDFMPNI